MRQYMRHPIGIPIEVSPETKRGKTTSIGSGGLAFRADHDFEPGMLVHVKIPLVSPVFDSDARVVWCRPAGSGFELGVEFLDADDAFKARMVEQLCHIENYRHAVRRSEGRDLSAEEAARECIAKYAAVFPTN